MPDQTLTYVGTPVTGFDFTNDGFSLPTTDENGDPALLYRFFQAYQNPTYQTADYRPSAITSVTWQSMYEWDKGGSSGTFVDSYGERDVFGINATVSRLTRCRAGNLGAARLRRSGPVGAPRQWFDHIWRNSPA